MSLYDTTIPVTELVTGYVNGFAKFIISFTFLEYNHDKNKVNN